MDTLNFEVILIFFVVSASDEVKQRAKKITSVSLIRIIELLNNI